MSMNGNDMMYLYIYVECRVNFHSDCYLVMINFLYKYLLIPGINLPLMHHGISHVGLLTLFIPTVDIQAICISQWNGFRDRFIIVRAKWGR